MIRTGRLVVFESSHCSAKLQLVNGWRRRVCLGAFDGARLERLTCRTVNGLWIGFLARNPTKAIIPCVLYQFPHPHWYSENFVLRRYLADCRIFPISEESYRLHRRPGTQRKPIYGVERGIDSTLLSPLWKLLSGTSHPGKLGCEKAIFIRPAKTD